MELSIRTLLEEKRLIIIEKHEIEYRLKSIKKTFDFSKCADFDENQLTGNLNRILYPKIKVTDCDRNEGN